MKSMRASNDKYLRLINRVPLLPIESEKDYTAARALLHELIERDESLQKSEIGYAKILGRLIQEYCRSFDTCSGSHSLRELNTPVLKCNDTAGGA